MITFYRGHDHLRFTPFIIDVFFLMKTFREFEHQVDKE